MKYCTQSQNLVEIRIKYHPTLHSALHWPNQGCLQYTGLQTQRDNYYHSCYLPSLSQWRVLIVSVTAGLVQGYVDTALGSWDSVPTSHHREQERGMYWWSQDLQNTSYRVVLPCAHVHPPRFQAVSVSCNCGRHNWKCEITCLCVCVCACVCVCLEKEIRMNESAPSHEAVSLICSRYKEWQFCHINRECSNCMVLGGVSPHSPEYIVTYHISKVSHLNIYNLPHK